MSTNGSTMKQNTFYSICFCKHIVSPGSLIFFIVHCKRKSLNSSLNADSLLVQWNWLVFSSLEVRQLSLMSKCSMQRERNEPNCGRMNVCSIIRIYVSLGLGVVFFINDIQLKCRLICSWTQIVCLNYYRNKNSQLRKKYVAQDNGAEKTKHFLSITAKITGLQMQMSR